MPPITTYAGRVLLDKATAEEIKKQTDILLQNKDVAQAWQAARHLKKELSALPAADVQPVLADYRAVSANLKVLALPLLEKEEVLGLCENNLDFLTPASRELVTAGFQAWLAGQDEEEQAGLREKIAKLIPTLELPASRIVWPARPDTAPVKMPITGGPGEMLEDHEATELARHQDKVLDIGGAPLPVDDATTLAETIFSQTNVAEDKETFMRRAHALILSRLRDVRAAVGLREYLERPFAVGGLGLSGEALEKAAKQIELSYNKLHTVPARPLPPPQATVMPPPAPEVVLKPAELKPVITPEPTKVVAPPEPKIPVLPPAPAPTPAAPAPRMMRLHRVAGPEDKPRVEDVKAPVARSLGAAEELKLMTIKDWRRFGGAPGGTAEILRRVELLKQESAMSRLQGIKYLRGSEFWQQYLKIGRASLAQGKKLGETLADAASNPAGLSEDEFFSISSLNSKLK